MSVDNIGAVAVIIVANFAYIGLLPRIFFRRDGRFNLQWWVTAFPLFISPLVLSLIELEFLEAFGRSIQIPAALISLASVALISLTLGSHRIPLALWHQDNDAPREIVTWGAYKWIRHPFYASFLLSQLAALLYAPHPVIAGAALMSAIALDQTAKKEEKKLAASELGSQYQKYLNQTGRFLPRFKAEA